MGGERRFAIADWRPGGLGVLIYKVKILWLPKGGQRIFSVGWIGGIKRDAYSVCALLRFG